jgi:O-antigen ligase
MNSLKPLHWVGIVVGSGLALYFAYDHLQYFGDVSFLGGVLLLEIIIASLWKYDQRFFVLLIIAVGWAGMSFPLQGEWTRARWVVLTAGSVAGFIIWTKNPRGRFGSLHLIAFFCVCAAFVSASVSQFLLMAFFKALSLLLLLTYCASGARLAVLGREDRFFRGLLLGTEIAVYFTAICYLGLGMGFLGNPNSLGAVTSVALFPLLLWGWVNSEGREARFRRLVALLLCVYLVLFSMERAGMVSVVAVTLVFCLGLHQYRLLVKVVALVLLLVAVTGILAPESLNKHLAGLKDAVIYKGHKELGFMASRRTPWEKSIASIKEHPWFGTGYGTSPTGEDPGLAFGKFSSSAESAREHGSSYMAITEWVGLLGVLPFAALLLVTVLNLWKVCVWMRRTANPRHYAIPLAMVVLAGLVHAAFEDWLFAVGFYLCVYFWAFAFVLADLVPDAVVVPAATAFSRISRPSPADFVAVLPTR